MVTIARNEALRTLGRRRESASMEAREVADHSLADELEAVGARVDLRVAMRDLSARDRALLRLRYASDLTQAGVAETLDLPEGTVKVLLHRLRKKLRDRLTDYGDD
jgi:RNA polymerase sigma factor (sigma-70 family)